MPLTSFATIPRVSHPDKLCDRICDAIVDAALQHDPRARVRVYAATSVQRVMVWGEIVSLATFDISAVIRAQITALGYTNPALRFTEDAAIDVAVVQQQPERVDISVESPSVVYGFACSETPEFLPLPLVLARALERRLDTLRHTGMFPYVRPGGRVSVELAAESNLPRVRRIELVIPHNHTVTPQQVQQDISIGVVEPVLYDYGLEMPKALVVNPNGPCYDDGPALRAGTSGQWLAADSYGYAVPAMVVLSGRHGASLPRAMAYGARYVAKNIVAAGLASRVSVEVHYGLVADSPPLLRIKSLGTAKAAPSVLDDFARQLLTFTPEAIADYFELWRPMYMTTASQGHFGAAASPWEKVAKARNFV